MKTARVPPAGATGWNAGQGREAAERVILVDTGDRVLGSMGKLDAHRGAHLHRAFSILIYDRRGRLLLQRRAAGKYHFAGCWSNTCCGHPRPGEATGSAARRRLEEEFGFSVALRGEGCLIYRARDAASGREEHEYLHLFRGVFPGAPRPDPQEIQAWRWMSPDRIRRALDRFPDRFTPWFPLLMGHMGFRSPIASCDD